MIAAQVAEARRAFEQRYPGFGPVTWVEGDIGDGAGGCYLDNEHGDPVQEEWSTWWAAWIAARGLGPTTTNASGPHSVGYVVGGPQLVRCTPTHHICRCGTVSTSSAPQPTTTEESTMSHLWYHPESESYIITLRNESPDPLCTDVTGDKEHTKRAREYFGPTVVVPSTKSKGGSS